MAYQFTCDNCKKPFEIQQRGVKATCPHCNTGYNTLQTHTADEIPVVYQNSAPEPRPQTPVAVRVEEKEFLIEKPDQ
jgi:hypothetical protein